MVSESVVTHGRRYPACFVQVYGLHNSPVRPPVTSDVAITWTRGGGGVYGVRVSGFYFLFLFFLFIINLLYIYIFFLLLIYYIYIYIYFFFFFFFFAGGGVCSLLFPLGSIDRIW